MNNIRVFIVVNSLVLAAWLGASFVTEVADTPSQKKAAKSDSKPALSEKITTTVKESSQQIKAPLPVARVE